MTVQGGQCPPVGLRRPRGHTLTAPVVAAVHAPAPAPAPIHPPVAVPAPAPAPAPAPGPAWNQVTPQLAHCRREADVFPTAWSRIDDTRFRVTAHWPAARSFFGPADDRHQDPMVVAETLRQATMLLTHAEFGSPLGTCFVMHDLQVHIRPGALLVADAGQPVDIDVVCSEVRRRRTGLNGMRTTMEFRRGGRLVAHGSSSLTCSTPQAYLRLRAPQLAVLGHPVPLVAGLEPEQVGRTRTEDVVLAPADRPHTWLLRLNTAHPTLFHRPNDHVPGMLLIEAARQAATAATGHAGPPPDSLAAAFDRYAELDRPCWIEARVQPPQDPGAPLTVRVRGHQDGQDVFTAEVHLPRPTGARTRP